MPFPAYVILPDFLEDEECDALRAFAVEQEPNFTASAVKDHTITQSHRHSRTLRQMGKPWRPFFEKKITALLPSLFDALGIPPFVPARFELQLTAHNHGEFFKRHIDTRTGGEAGDATVRLISFLYYLPAAPKRFDGGALRLYGFGDDSEHVDIEPVRNTLAAFPSWAWHEVLPVTCGSGRFEDSRFAINGWVRRAGPPAAQNS